MNKLKILLLLVALLSLTACGGSASTAGITNPEFDLSTEEFKVYPDSFYQGEYSEVYRLIVKSSSSSSSDSGILRIYKNTIGDECQWSASFSTSEESYDPIFFMIPVYACGNQFSSGEVVPRIVKVGESGIIGSYNTMGLNLTGNQDWQVEEAGDGLAQFTLYTSLTNEAGQLQMTGRTVYVLNQNGIHESIQLTLTDYETGNIITAVELDE